ncbi:MAG: T9SS type A sorting domain-containing protein [Calditrichaeota bacterium]|nr:T9SS type A sorting domain-containing protein [Calditrichota bacterium]
MPNLKHCLISISIFIGCFTHILGYAEPQVEFIRSYGGISEDHFMDIYAVSNGDYVMCGYKINGQGLYDYWVIRIDDNGNEIWSNSYNITSAYSLIETDDGNFLSAGCDADGIKAIMTDGNGELIWSGNYARGVCKAVIELKSGEYLLTGYVTIDGGKGYLAMIDANGNLLWEHIYEPEVRGEFNAMRETVGGVVLAGMNNNYHEGWLVKVSIENEGEILWERRFDDDGIMDFRSIASVADGGFVLTGLLQDNQRFGAPRTFYIMNVDDEGNQQWLDFPHNDRDHEWATTIIRAGNTGYIAAGKQRQGNGMDVGYAPAIYSTTSEGVLRWHTVFDLDSLIDIPRCVFNSVVIGEDGSILAAGDVSWSNENGTDGIVVKLEPELLEPIIFRFSPEDTVFSVLPGDTVTFMARARDQQGDELSNLWISNEDTLGADTVETIIFEELGEYLVQCQISDGEFTSAVRWHVSAEEFYIDSFSPDSLSWAVRRPREVDFSLNVRAMEGIEPRYRWIMTDRNRRENDLGDAAEVTYAFDLSGTYRLEGSAFYEDVEQSVHWQIVVNSVLYWWNPHGRQFEVNLHDQIEFNAIPFNPESDSLDFLWLVDDEIEEEVEDGIFYSFDTDGIHTVAAIVHDGAEVDTVLWSVTVVDPNSTNDNSDGLLPTEVTLYPATPNPFNNTVKLEFSLPVQGYVSLQLFDLTGRLVETLVEERLEAGGFSAVWNADMQVAGVYFYRLNAGHFQQTKKLILVK